MAKLVSMKVSAEERRKRSEPSAVVGDPDIYPYGLQLRLGNDELEKLGLEDLPDVGESIELYAKVKVTSTSSRDQEGGGKSQSVELQITSMCLEGKGADKVKTQAEKIYS